MRILFLALLLASPLARAADATCEDSFCQQLHDAGLSSRAYHLLEARIAHEHYGKAYAAIADYSLPSSVPRLFVLNLAEHTFKAYPVSHGINSGGLEAVVFSNIANQRQSALGFMRTSPHSGRFGTSLLLSGLSPSNSRLTPEAAILIHCAEYSSEQFYQHHGFWGRSDGCLAVPCEDLGTIVNELGSGALVLAYHDALWDEAQTNPIHQSIAGHGPIPPATRWENDENAHGKTNGPYHLRYGKERTNAKRGAAEPTEPVASPVTPVEPVVSPVSPAERAPANPDPEISAPAS